MHACSRFAAPGIYLRAQAALQVFEDLAKVVEVRRVSISFAFLPKRLLR